MENKSGWKPQRHTTTAVQTYRKKQKGGAPGVDRDRKGMQQVWQVGGFPVKKGLVDEDKPVNITTGVKWGTSVPLHADLYIVSPKLSVAKTDQSVDICFLGLF